jgi:hypothetical protein
MRMLKIIAAGVLSLSLLSACTPSYRETLELKLQGKSPDERRAILAQECGQEIQKGMKLENKSKMLHFENMKEICEEMTGQKVNAIVPPVPAAMP